MKHETIDIEALAARCDPIFAVMPESGDTERRIAIAVYRTLAGRGPATFDEIARAAGATTTQVEHALDGSPGVLRDESGRVVGFWGLALQPMDHRLLVDDHVLYGWCAEDTLFLPEILGRDARVESRCPVTDRPIRLAVRGDGPAELDPPGAVVSMFVPDAADVGCDAGISSTCPHIRFFASREAGESWAEGRGDGLFLLTVQEAWELGRALNRRRYGDLLGERPTSSKTRS